jgi:hypothetical protein
MKRALEAVLSRGKQAEMQIRSADQFEYGKDEYSGE